MGNISIPDRLIDYLIYYECGKDEKKNPGSWWSTMCKTTAGGMVTAVNWDAAGYDVGDNMGITKVGITPQAAQNVLGKGVFIDSPEKWLKVVKNFWDTS